MKKGILRMVISYPSFASDIVNKNIVDAYNLKPVEKDVNTHFLYDINKKAHGLNHKETFWDTLNKIIRKIDIYESDIPYKIAIFKEFYTLDMYLKKHTMKDVIKKFYVKEILIENDSFGNVIEFIEKDVIDVFYNIHQVITNETLKKESYCIFSILEEKSSVEGAAFL